MDTQYSFNAGSIIFCTLLLCAGVFGIGVYLEFGFFADRNSMDLAMKILVGTLVIGFFLFILLDKSEQAVMTDQFSSIQ